MSGGRDKNGKWVKGQTGNPGGGYDKRRRRIINRFLRDIEKTWEQQGIAALKVVAEKQPAKFVEIVSALLPKDATMSVEHKHTHAVAWMQAIQSLPPVGEVIEGNNGGQTALEAPKVEPAIIIEEKEVREEAVTVEVSAPVPTQPVPPRPPTKRATRKHKETRMSARDVSFPNIPK